MEEIKERLLEQSQDIKDIKKHVIDLVKQGAVHNQVLIQHEQRSTTLERLLREHERDSDARLKPLEMSLHARHAHKTMLLGSSGLLGIMLSLLALYLRSAK